MIKVYNEKQELVYTLEDPTSKDNVDWDYLRGLSYTGWFSYFHNDVLYRRDCRKDGEYYNENGPACWISLPSDEGRYFACFYSLGHLTYTYWIGNEEWLKIIKELEYKTNFEELLK